MGRRRSALRIRKASSAQETCLSVTGGNRGTASEKLRFSLMNHVSYTVLKATEHQLLIGKQLWVSGYLYVFLE